MSPDDVNAQLDRILSSAVFARAPQLCRFLRVAVEAARDGRGDALKEYRIGVEVFGRGDAFDPRVDPIVRVQAAKLRSKLAEYYAGTGAGDPIVIGVPKGSYAAELRPRRAPDTTRPAPPDRSRIAVLPFVAMSDDREIEHFGDGLAEELINRLVRVPTLRVVARTSAFRFKGVNADVREIGAKLDVGTVLEGSVRRSGGRLRVTAQLIDVASGFHLFSRSWQRERGDFFELQDELAQAVVDEIIGGDGVEPSPVLGKAPVASLEARTHYLKGVFSMSNRFADLPRTLDHFRAALAIEPAYAPAWAGLAHTYLLLAWFYLMPPREAMPRMEEAARRTLELDGESAQGHASLGLYRSGYEWNWSSADAHFRRAAELQPGLASIYPYEALVSLMPQGRLDEACWTVERGLALDPFNPQHHAMAIVVLTQAGRVDDALRQHALGDEVSPSYPPILGAGALAWERKGRLDVAIPMLRRLCELTQDRPAPLSHLGHALAAAGERDEARAIAHRLAARDERVDLDVARVLVGLHDDERALDRLDAAIDARDIHLVTVPSDARFARLRERPRYRAAMRRMGLA